MANLSPVVAGHEVIVADPNYAPMYANRSRRIKTEIGKLRGDPARASDWLHSLIRGGIALGIHQLRRGVELDPANFIAHWALGYALLSVGDLTAASAEVAWLMAAGPHVPYTIQLQSLVLAQQGDTEQAHAMVSALDLSPFDNHITFHFAEVFAMCGETERALDVLESSVRKGFCPTTFIAVHCRFLESLRSHPRFAPIVATARAMSEAIRRDMEASPA